jgi:hypothetical protein
MTVPSGIDASLPPRAVDAPALLPTSRVALLGFGVLACAFARMLAPRGCALVAWDAGIDGLEGPRSRARIESAGVDAAVSMADAMRGARLVLLEGIALADGVAALLQPGQHVMDLATATAPDVDAVLVALGLPAGARWQQVRAAALRDMANCAATEMPAVHRGELP